MNKVQAPLYYNSQDWQPALACAYIFFCYEIKLGPSSMQ